MGDLVYQRLFDEEDKDIPQLTAIYHRPEIAQYIHISDNYFRYITATENVHFYKVYAREALIGAIHLEKQATTLYMDILVFPAFQRTGLGTRILKDIQNDIFGLNYERMEVAIDERNTPSLALFETAGFIRSSKEDELINLVYQRGKKNVSYDAAAKNEL